MPTNVYKNVDLRYLLDTPKTSDITLAFGQMEFSVHKAVLMSASDVFCKILTTSAIPIKELRMEDYGYTQFEVEIALQYMYGFKVPRLIPRKLVQRYYCECITVGRRFEIPGLEVEAFEALRKLQVPVRDEHPGPGLQTLWWAVPLLAMGVLFALSVETLVS